MSAEVVALPTPEPEPVSFDTFYALFARHEARKDALKAWGQMPPGDHLDAIIAAAAWRRILLARHAEGYCPLPASWLRGERFWDELPADNMPTHASHVQAQSTPLPERGQIPPDVLQRIKQIMGSRK